MNEFFSLMFPLALTIVIEYIVVQLMAKEKLVLLQVIIVNVITNPAINIIYRYLLIDNIKDTGLLYLVVTAIEIIIWILEAIMYKYMLKIEWKTAFKYSIISNLVSYLSSFII